MTRKTKQELIAQVVALLDALIEVEDNAPTIMVSAKEQPVEMLTIKECTEAVRGLSEPYCPSAHCTGQAAPYPHWSG